MTHEFLPSPASENQNVDQIQKNLESFDTFDRWMDEQLDELVARWIHTAAPNAERASFKAGRAISR
jgi:hypothetical protein